MTAWYLLAAETIDETMARLIQRKREVVDAVTDGRELPDGGLIEGVVKELRDGQPFRHLHAVATDTRRRRRAGGRRREALAQGLAGSPTTRREPRGRKVLVREHISFPVPPVWILRLAPPRGSRRPRKRPPSSETNPGRAPALPSSQA